jgi:endoglucanase
MLPVDSARALGRLRRVASTPTAPFHEARVLARVRAEAARLGLPCAADAAGNLRVAYENPPSGAAGEALRRAPFVAVAHTDHPGFEVLGRGSRGLVEAAWMGGVRPAFFRAAQVVVHGPREVAGVVERVRLDADRRVERLWLRLEGDAPAGAPGGFALPAFAFDRPTRLVHGRALDDLAGVAALLSALEALVAAQAEGVLWCLFTRAEEVGFVGAAAAAREGGLPPAARVVSVETSAAGPVARQGAGPVVRVGDRASVYDRVTVGALDAVAAELGAARRGRFRHQRALMSGGTCEATLFARRGWRTAGLALPLANYHNMKDPPPQDPGGASDAAPALAPEAIHADDYLGLVRLLAALALRGHDAAAAVAADADALGTRLRASEERWRGRLFGAGRGPAER